MFLNYWLLTTLEMSSTYHLEADGQSKDFINMYVFAMFHIHKFQNMAQISQVYVWRRCRKYKKERVWIWCQVATKNKSLK